MKTSLFNKVFHVEGVNGKITGTIIVTMNCSTKTIDYNNPSTHDTEKKNVSVHKIEAYIDKTLWWKDNDLRSENIVLNEVERCKKQMLERMTSLANDKPIQSFTDKFNAI
jgi:hypothetical protein